MAHEITSTDNLVLHRRKAWHGLGIVVDKAPSPVEALQLAGMDWEVEPLPLYTKIMNADGTLQEVEVPSHVVNHRRGIEGPAGFLGVVSSSYEITQNRYLAEFCQLLAEEGKSVQIESAGTIRGGRRVWFLLKGDSFEIGDGDKIYPYLLGSNGHDGMTCCAFDPTSVRVVCSNTLHQVIPRGSGHGLNRIVLKHTANIKERLEQVRSALREFNSTTSIFRGEIEKLQKSSIDRESLIAYFVERYCADFGTPSNSPQTAWEKKAKEKLDFAIKSCLNRFENEEHLSGASKWTAMNAYSGFLQHDRPIRSSDPVIVTQRRIDSSLFGVDQLRTQAAFLKMLQS